MTWFPVAFAIANAALLIFGIDNPSRAFSLLPYLAIIALIRILVEGVKGFRSPAGSLRAWGRQFRTPLESVRIPQYPRDANARS
jgi:hypothetical protein